MAAIERVEARVIAPPTGSLTWADRPPQFQTLILVRVWDSTGADGVGATMAYSGVGYDSSILGTLRMLIPRLIGADGAVPEARWRGLQDFSLPLAPGALAVLDIALWDMCARVAGRPLYQFLGGERESVLAYGSTAQLADVGAYVDAVSSLRDQGYRAVKFHSWNVPNRDVDMLRTVATEHRDAGLLFMHDAETMYSRRDALRVGRVLDDLGFHWFEAPFDDHDVAGYVDLRNRVRVPIVPHGNTITDLKSFAVAAAAGAWDAARIDIALEGFTLGRMMANVAHASGLEIEPQSWGYSLIQAANLHFSLAFEQSNLFEQPVPVEPYEFGVRNPLRIGGDGQVRAPAAPGLGLEVDWAAIDAATIEVYCEPR